MVPSNSARPAQAVDHDSAALVQALSHPKAYPERPRQVSLVETHISWVFLTDRHVYKLKKPVKFDFLDFSTPELRQQACQDEVTLNKRLAPDVYLGVVPVTRSWGRLQVGGRGAAVDWLVRMRRLPADRALDWLLLHDQLGEGDVRRTGHTLAEFYSALPPLSLRTDQYRQRIEDHVQANRHELLSPGHGFEPALVKRVHAAQLRVLRLSPELFDDRVRDGRIVDGHGDLKPDHIYLTQPPTVIDCIEFNPEFRQLDVLDELSFLAVECAFLGNNSVGGQILQHYCQSSGDLPPAQLLSFYMSYRACVRAKVNALRSDQVDADQRADLLQKANSYLELADRYANEIGPPVVIIVRGVTGTGKSTLSEVLGESLGVERLDTDAIRRDLFGPSDQPADYDAQNYQPKMRLQVYEKMFEQAATLLAVGHSVILDGTFLTTRLRAQAASLARRQGAAVLLVHCECPDEVAAERVAARTGSDSESRPDFVTMQRAQEQTDPPGLSVCHVDTTISVPGMLSEVLPQVKAVIKSNAAAPAMSAH